jgi:lipase chaperone LimK
MTDVQYIELRQNLPKDSEDMLYLQRQSEALAMLYHQCCHRAEVSGDDPRIFERKESEFWW